ncbi:MAG: formate dehydrogenase [Bacillales bacterium]|jgi:uncharacterized damage-inducible protein DinB|nr:formate dehydrogenase [Bacillales bacterium]
METIGLKKQFDLVRSRLISFIESCPEEILDILPMGHNNSIRWILGHILVSTEGFAHPLEKYKNSLPAHFYELFEKGSSIDLWVGEIPTTQELKNYLIEQQGRISFKPIHRDDTPLKSAILTFETVGELMYMHCYHETLHLGQLQSMKKVLTA